MRRHEDPYGTDEQIEAAMLDVDERHDVLRLGDDKTYWVRVGLARPIESARELALAVRHIGYAVWIRPHDPDVGLIYVEERA